jgi:tetratricopeptide (TPR) repeat protein
MNCEKCEALLIEAALGRAGAVSEDDAVVLNHHLERCERCRAEFDDLKRLFAAARTELAEPLPEALHATHQAVIRAVSRRRRAVKVLKLGAGLLGAATAACVILALSAGIARDNAPRLAQVDKPAPITSIPEQIPAPLPVLAAPEPSTPKLDPDFIREIEAQTDPKAAFSLVRQSFEEMTSRQEGGDLLGLIALCDTIITRWPDSDRALKARELISRCYMQIPDPEAARVAFIAYADDAGARAAAKLALTGADTSTAQAEADRVTGRLFVKQASVFFWTEKNYTAALSYGDVVLTRYPGSESARNVRNMMGQYYQRIRQPGRAAAEFRAVIAEAPESRAASIAWQDLPLALLKAGRSDEAVQSYLDYSQSHSDPKEQASGYYNAGNTLWMMGEKDYPQAAQWLRKVLRDYPDTPYAAASKRKLTLIVRNVVTKHLSPEMDLLDIEKALTPESEFLKGIPELKEILGDQEMVDILNM